MVLRLVMDFVIKNFEEIDSTQNEARSFLDSDDYDISKIYCFIADQQKAGRGRQGKSWSSPKDSGLYMTLIIPSKINLFEKDFDLVGFSNDLTQDTAKQIIKILKPYINDTEKLRIKPINDIYYDQKKLAGILIETVTKNDQSYFLIGIGLNLKNTKSFVVSSDESKAEPISLEEITSTENFNKLSKEFLIRNIARVLIEFLRNP